MPFVLPTPTRIKSGLGQRLACHEALHYELLRVRILANGVSNGQFTRVFIFSAQLFRC